MQWRNNHYPYHTLVVIREFPTADAYVPFMQLQFLIQPHCCAERHSESTHTHLHTHLLDWDECMHVYLELKGVWACSVIGAERGLTLWITHTHSPSNADTHRHLHTAHKKGGWQKTSEKSMSWWPWIFPFLYNSAPRQWGRAAHTVQTRIHTHTICNKSGAERGKKTERLEWQKMRGICTRGIKKKENLPPSHTVSSTSSLLSIIFLATVLPQRFCNFM